MRDALSGIRTAYVLMLLDDFFLRRSVTDEDVSKIEECIHCMEKDKSIGAFNLVPLHGADSSRELNGFYYIEPGTPYRLNAQACIWRKETLYNSILDIESPWEWEVYGNLRNDVLLKDKIYALKDGAREPFNYGFYDYGKREEDGAYVAHSGIMRGKWYLPSVKGLFKSNGIFVDYSIRGIYREGFKKKVKRNNLLRKILVLPYRKIRGAIQPNEINANEELNNKKKEENMERLVYPYIKEVNDRV